ncbi:MAG: 50S ribosomal protein L9 [Acidimicrobiia bacterium]
MKIVLRQDVEQLGKKGDLLEVAPGYARNYLVPRGLAMVASKGSEKQAAAMRRNREVRDTREREQAQAVATKLTSAPVQVPARAGEGGKLFGSVTASDIASAIEAATGVTVDRRKIALDEPLKALGTTEVGVTLHSDVTVMVTVEVVAS